MTELTTGRCLCGAVTWRYSGPEIWQGHCHCESCRRATSSPFTTYIGVPKTAFEFTGAAPQVFESSPGVRRAFCGRCGSPVSYETQYLPDEIHLYAASLDHPEAAAPGVHFHSEEMLPWVKLADGLPRRTGTGEGQGDIPGPVTPP